MTRANQFGILWTDAELAVLRSAYTKSGGLKRAMKLLPHRSRQAVQRKSSALGLTRERRRWTQQERERLQHMWGICTLDEIVATMNRPIGAVHDQAVKLGLQTGAPDGWETISDAARRAGYDLTSMKRVLRWAGVRMPKAYTKGRSNKSQNRIVDPTDVDDAVAAYIRTEPINTAALRLGMSRMKLVRLLKKHGVKGQRAKGPKTHNRVVSDEVDAALAAQAAWLKTRIRIDVAAKLVGVARHTLRAWLVKHGVEKRNRREPVDVRDVDRVVALELKRPDDRIPIRGRKPRPPKLAEMVNA